MKTNRFYLIILLIACIVQSCGNKEKGSAEEAVLVVDVVKSYMQKRVSIQEIADIEYLPLGISEDFLWKGWVNACTDRWIVNTDGHNGDVLFFDRKGNPAKRFNRLGGSAEEYSTMGKFLWDDEMEEMYVYDNSKKNTYVYDMDGRLKRLLPYAPEASYYHMLSFDSERLIAYKQVYDPLIPNAYHILSKQTGELLEEIIIPADTKIDQRATSKNSDGKTMVAVSIIYPLLQHASGFVLNELSNDTIFLLRPTMELEPLVVAEPTRTSLSPEVLLFFSKETDSYRYLMSTEKKFDFNTMQGFPYTYLMYDKQGKTIYRQDIFNADFPSQPFMNVIPETCVYPSGKESQLLFTLEPMELIEARENDELSGKLKEIAATLNEDDNPVLMIATLK